MVTDKLARKHVLSGRPQVFLAGTVSFGLRDRISQLVGLPSEQQAAAPAALKLERICGRVLSVLVVRQYSKLGSVRSADLALATVFTEGTTANAVRLILKLKADKPLVWLVQSAGMISKGRS